MEVRGKTAGLNQVFIHFERANRMSESSGEEEESSVCMFVDVGGSIGASGTFDWTTAATCRNRLAHIRLLETIDSASQWSFKFSVRGKREKKRRREIEK